MAGVALLTFFGAVLGLTIESNSPEAYCPPITDVKKAVAARVGDVQGEVYEARYGLVRDAQTGRNFVSLVLVDSQSREVLRREIPVSDESCSDATLAIAVILERYFSGVIRPPVESSPTERGERRPGNNAVESRSDTAPDERGRVGSESSEPSPAPQTSQKRDPEPETVRPPPPSTSRKYFLRGALGMGQEAQPAFHLALGRALAPWAGAYAELSTSPFSTEIWKGPYDVKSWFWALSLGVDLKVSFSRRLQAALAPHVGVSFQGAEVSGPDLNSNGVRTRWVPALGSSLRVGYQLSDVYGIGAQVHGIALLGGRSFVVKDGEVSREVLDLPLGRGDASLYFSYAF